MYAGSRPARALWIEILLMQTCYRRFRSRPARALWIEIFFQRFFVFLDDVEAREGLVD